MHIRKKKKTDLSFIGILDVDRIEVQLMSTARRGVGSGL